ncbi:hypothetical protein QBC34DRAFT_300053 [Podospora aff. communis PSN243]|uniref:Mid2 domain-containing protein n=1 Tax=Podospora aff. communis PSN243 TaxID=3040156 RepID=A0AAV9GLS1_9PEZI|nr:hypothetical protein QBC34DRAFT_300053 [Podospora aff. communis PSN243]
MHSLLLLLLAALLSPSLAQSNTITCFGFNGGNYTGNIACPGSNACCGSGATCLSNRICVNPNQELVRAPCRVFPHDETCAQICLYDEPSLGGRLPRVKICDDGSLCCDNLATCCENGLGIFLDESGRRVSARATAATTSFPPNPTGTDRITLTPSVSTSPTTSLTLSFSESLQATPPVSTPVNPSRSGLPSNSNTTTAAEAENTALKVGLGIGIPLAVIATAALVYCLLRRRKKNSARSAQPLEMGTESGVAEMAVPHRQQAYDAPPLPAKDDRYYYSGRAQGGGGMVKPVEMGTPAVVELGSGEVGDGRKERRYELG